MHGMSYKFPGRLSVDPSFGASLEALTERDGGSLVTMAGVWIWSGQCVSYHMSGLGLGQDEQV